MTEIKAILFDMDGVLIEAKDWHYEALNAALRLFGMEIQREDHLAVYDGLPTRRKLEILSKTRGLPKKLHAFINELKQARTLELAVERCRPMFIHQYALHRLRQDGFHLVVCSNSIRNSIEVMLRHADLLRHIEFFLSNEDVVKAKPDPEIYTAAIVRLGLTPGECLIVEDNENGIRAARASGAHVMEVATVDDVTYDRICRAINAIRSA